VAFFYRYQESNHGIHNYNDQFFIGIDVCLYIREHIQQHNSINSFVESYIRLFSCKLNNHAVVEAYLMFDALLDDPYEFKCSLCGDYPWALVADANRKVSFKCNFNEIDQSDEDSDQIDCYENMALQKL